MGKESDSIILSVEGRLVEEEEKSLRRGMFRNAV